jgi:hypothetical protein
MTCLNDNTSGNPSGGGAATFAVLATNLEWIPLVRWYPKTKSEYSTEACAKGIELMGDFPDFMGNAVHWADVANAASKIAKWGVPIWRAAIDVGGTAIEKHNPALAAGFRKIAGAVVDRIDASNPRGRKRK